MTNRVTYYEINRPNEARRVAEVRHLKDVGYNPYREGGHPEVAKPEGYEQWRLADRWSNYWVAVDVRENPRCRAGAGNLTQEVF